MAILAAIIWGTFFALTFFNYRYDLSGFINIGDVYGNRAKIAPNVTVIRQSDGYDGEFYYRLALDPFTSKATDHGVTIDCPSLRHQRIVYPLTVWAASLGGNWRYVPAMLIVVNFAALVMLAWLGARLAAMLGREPAWGILFSLYPGLIFCFERDLCEPMATMFLVSSLIFYHRKKWPHASVTLSLAVLTREPMLIVAMGITGFQIIKFVFRRGLDKKQFVWSLLPFACFATIQIIMRLNWGEFPILASGDANVGAPMSGFVEYIRWHIRASDIFGLVDYTHMAGLAMIFGAGLYYGIRDRFSSPFHISWLIFAVMFFTLSTVWKDTTTYIRVFTDFFVITSYIALTHRTAVLDKLMLAFTFVWFLLTAHNQLYTGFMIIRHGLL